MCNRLIFISLYLLSSLARNVHRTYRFADYFCDTATVLTLPGVNPNVGRNSVHTTGFLGYRAMKRNVIWNQDNGNRINIFWRAALGMAYLYLNFAAYQLVGIEGVAITSGFFLIAQFSPFIMRAFSRRRNNQVAIKPVICTGLNVEKKSNSSIIPFRLASQTEKNGL